MRRRNRFRSSRHLSVGRGGGEVHLRGGVRLAGAVWGEVVEHAEDGPLLFLKMMIGEIISVRKKRKENDNIL